MDLIRLDPSPKLDEDPDEHRQTSYALENVPDEDISEGAIEAKSNSPASAGGS